MMRFMAILILLITSCSQRQPLGMKDHTFGRKGKHIVWLQVAGLEPEHFSLLKLKNDDAEEVTPVEKMNCFGSLWSYNLFELRPDAAKGFLSQILGSQKITGKCEDFDRRTVWSFFENAGYQVGVYEGPEVGKHSLNNFLSCKGDFRPLKNSFLWLQRPAKGEVQTFHYQENTGLDQPGVYYDKSCQQGACIIPLQTNVKEMWKAFIAKNAKTFFTARIFSIDKKIDKKRTSELVEDLTELEDLIEFFQKEAEKQSILLVVSSSGAKGFELPRAGYKWAQFLKKGRHVNYRKTRLQSPLYAFGEGAENFCGIYEEARVLERFIWMPEQKLFNLTF